MVYRNRLLPGLVLFALSVFGSEGPSAAAPCQAWLARAVSLQGSIQVRRSGESEWRSVRRNDAFCSGDAVRLGTKSRAAFRLRNDAVLRLDQRTNLTFSDVEEGDRVLLDLLEGAVHFFSHRPRSLKVTTPFLNAAVEGTEFYVRVEGGETQVSVLEGRVAAASPGGSVSLGKGQSAVARAGEKPVLRAVVKPRDAVQWTLYYPPVLDLRPDELAGSPGNWQAAARASMEALNARDFAAAFAALEEAPKEIFDARFFVYRASLLLAVGRLEEAREDLRTALAIDPQSSSAYALESTIAVARNEKEEGLDLARRAVEFDSASATGWIALSYALQGLFELERAREATEQAVRSDPENALAWARLAELRESLGDLRGAAEAAQKASSLDPNLARTQTVLGFSELLNMRTGRAKNAFARAIELDQADPLPRLGLGLAKIRGGDLTAGREELEVAAGLDPGGSLVRSYLGKAYYEEKRNAPAARELEIAKELDPLDPTPWFYDAIRKQTINRTVEALQDLQRSIELNDNRAVYRSRLLLDEDLAARSANLARIYADLGFEQLARVEGFKSVNADPTDYSGHRFLAETYAALPRHELARVSEFLQSQLLQPLNSNPVSPTLSQTNLAFLSGTGPSAVGFGEFNPLFLRNGVHFRTNGVVGGNETLGDELVLSGLAGKFSFNVAQFHYRTDGFRENNDLHRNIYDVLLQGQLNPQLGVQTELVYSKFDRGDLVLGFNRESFNPDLRKEDAVRSARVGLRFSPAPCSDLLVSGIYSRAEIDTDAGPLIDFKVERDRRGQMGELQHVFRSAHLSNITGLGSSRQHVEDTIETYGMRFQDESDLKHFDFYTYNVIRWPSRATWTLGASRDLFRQGDFRKSQWNPKLGVLWEPFPGTAVRAAGFRTLRRLVVGEQTLEPTQVAGFNQFFDDYNGTDARHYGVGVDQKIGNVANAGIEVSRRDLKIPFTKIPSMEDGILDFSEKFARGYLGWTPSRWAALSGDVEYEGMSTDPEMGSPGYFSKLETCRTALSLGLFGPGALSSQAKAWYVRQSGEFGSVFSGFSGESSRFWVFDASIKYLLPRRLGAVELTGKNLLNRTIKYHDLDSSQPRIAQERLLLARVTLEL